MPNLDNRLRPTLNSPEPRPHDLSLCHWLYGFYNHVLADNTCVGICWFNVWWWDDPWPKSIALVQNSFRPFCLLRPLLRPNQSQIHQTRQSQYERSRTKLLKMGRDFSHGLLPPRIQFFHYLWNRQGHILGLDLEWRDICGAECRWKSIDTHDPVSNVVLDFYCQLFAVFEMLLFPNRILHHCYWRTIYDDIWVGWVCEDLWDWVGVEWVLYLCGFGESFDGCFDEKDLWKVLN